MNLRPYQREAIDAVNDHFATKDTNPLVVVPTAGGKTIIFATLIKEWLNHPEWSPPRVCILAHVRELLGQAETKLKAVWPDAPVGVWSAGMKRKEGSRQITIAGIQSIYKRAFDFDPFDVLLVDEAHLIPTSGEGMYRKFVDDCKLANPNIRVLGFTATPYRLDGGHIAQQDYVLNDVCYEANIGQLIEDGYLSKLRSKATATVISTEGVKVRQGEFLASDLERVANTDSMVSAAVAEIVEKGKERKAWLIFCCGVEHAWHVSAALKAQGIEAPVVTGDTKPDARAETLRRFDCGELQAVVNVNCLTTGLDVTRIDLIALLRPTKSTALYVQMVGRGFRLHHGKSDCLILDFGNNVRRHGPVDDVRIKTALMDGDGGEAPTKECPTCAEIVHAAVLECPACGRQFPPREVKHEKHADAVQILSTDATPWEVPIIEVDVEPHNKEGKLPSLRVAYRGTMETHREWVCLEHPGYAGLKAKRWWSRRFGEPVPTTVADAMGDLFLSHKLTKITKAIKVRRSGKYTEIIDVVLDVGTSAALAAVVG